MNDDWYHLPEDQRNDIINSGLIPADGREAALVATLQAGAYTVFVESQDGQFGVGQFEIYELENNQTSKHGL